MKRSIVLVLFLAVPALSQEENYYVGHDPKYVNILFESEAELETIIGMTNKATGTITADFSKKTGSVSITVPADSLKTGIDLRDEHLRSEMWLNAAKFPDITFRSKEVKPVKDKPNKVEVTGDFSLHGVTREMKVIVDWREVNPEAAKKAKFPDGKWIRFSAEFNVKLSDFGIKIPEIAVGKVADDLKLKMVIFAGTAKPEKK